MLKVLAKGLVCGVGLAAGTLAFFEVFFRLVYDASYVKVIKNTVDQL